ncbi:hypothetical protein OXX69_004811 [Metschnikowia pulcherrima]
MKVYQVSFCFWTLSHFASGVHVKRLSPTANEIIAYPEPNLVRVYATTRNLQSVGKSKRCSDCSDSSSDENEDGKSYYFSDSSTPGISSPDQHELSREDEIKRADGITGADETAEEPSDVVDANDFERRLENLDWSLRSYVSETAFDYLRFASDYEKVRYEMSNLRETMRILRPGFEGCQASKLFTNVEFHFLGMELHHDIRLKYLEGDYSVYGSKQLTEMSLRLFEFDISLLIFSDPLSKLPAIDSDFESKYNAKAEQFAFLMEKYEKIGFENGLLSKRIQNISFYLRNIKSLIIRAKSLGSHVSSDAGSSRDSARASSAFSDVAEAKKLLSLDSIIKKFKDLKFDLEIVSSTESPGQGPILDAIKSRFEKLTTEIQSSEFAENQKMPAIEVMNDVSRQIGLLEAFPPSSETAKFNENEKSDMSFDRERVRWVPEPGARAEFVQTGFMEEEEIDAICSELEVIALSLQNTWQGKAWVPASTYQSTIRNHQNRLTAIEARVNATFVPMTYKASCMSFSLMMVKNYLMSMLI